MVLSRPRKAFTYIVAAACLGAVLSPAAAAAIPRPAATTKPAPSSKIAPQPADGVSEHVADVSLPAKLRPPLPSSTAALRTSYADSSKDSSRQGVTTKKSTKKSTSKSKRSAKAAAACSPSDFTSRSGWALVDQIRASSVDCVNSLFSLTGGSAQAAFNESQMSYVAYALRDNGTNYPGDNSTATEQLALYLRAGYYVHWYHPQDVGTYGASLENAIRSGLDSFFGNSRAFTVSAANGDVLGEVVTLIDSAEQNARYLYVVKRLLDGYNSSYNAHRSMLVAVNNTYTVLFRGHQVPAFQSAVKADPSIVSTLSRFIDSHLSLLSTDNSYLTSNAGRELARFLQYPSLLSTVRPLVQRALVNSSMTGATAPLWVGVAEMTDYYDKANCSLYGTCNLSTRLASSVLPIQHTCSSVLTIRAQEMTSAQLSDTCSSLLNQNAYFHSVVRDPGPVANDYNTSIEVNVFDSSTDYQTYAGAMFGIDTNNGGMYLEGNPADPNNQARFIAYEAEWVRPTFQIWNLNHEYTHYLDGRFDMAGDFNTYVATPTIWWIEGFAEYISYSYRNVDYTDAMYQAGLGTYSLRTLFDTTYSADQTRIYNWGYLAVRYMLERHPSDVTQILNYYRAGNYTAARSYMTSTIGSRYDNDWYSWLASCAAGACTGGGTTPPTNAAPTADFTSSVSGRNVTFTDRSSDSDGTIASRSWDFGDGATSTATSPSHAYTADGSYSVTLTVTDDQGATATKTRAVQIGGGSTPTTECTDSDTRVLGKDCSRSNRSASNGDYDYLYLYLPSGVASLTITASGGSGDCDLLYSGSGWATGQSATHRSTNPGNSESITVANPQDGYNYVSLQGADACTGVTVTTSY